MAKKIMAKKFSKKLLYKKESERTKSEKLFRAIVCFIVVIYTAILGYLLVNANANLAEAEANFADASLEACVINNN